MLVALAVVASGALVAATPGAALADHGGGHAIKVVQVACPGWVGAQPGWYAEPLNVVRSIPSFLVSERRIVVNDLDSPITATFTSQTGPARLTRPSTAAG